MYSINCILFLHKFQLYVSGPFPPNSRFTFDYYWSYTFFRYSLDNTKFLGCDSTGMVGLASEYPTANPQLLRLSSTKFKSGELVCTCFFYTFSKGKWWRHKNEICKFMGLFFFVDFALNDIIEASSQINALSLSNAPPYSFRPLRPLCNKRPCLKEWQLLQNDRNR